MGYAIGICELYHESIHGVLSAEEKEVNTHYLLLYKFKCNEDEDAVENINYCLRIGYYLKQKHARLMSYGRINILKDIYTNEIFPAYSQIVEHPSYGCPEIVEYFYLPSQHCICIKKTFWIKIIQRTWKRILAERRRVVAERMQYGSIRHREVFGRWPTSCAVYPRLPGMLS
jgi:hypothetical protein